MGDEGAAPTPAPTTSTTSGAQAVFQTNAWLSAAAVAVYTTKALWVKLREMGFGKGKSEDEKDAGEANAEHSNEVIVEGPFPEDQDQVISQPQFQLQSQLRLKDLNVS
ncbi:hypothetical protein ACLKA6_006401 [Drosophila palustris]